MHLQDLYPIVVTPHLTACRDFYLRWFGLEIVFEASWFLLLQAPDGGRASLAFMHPDHPSAPPGPEPFSGKGMCLEFGQRRFGLFDPAGVWIDVVQQIAPEAGWWDRYLTTRGAAP